MASAIDAKNKSIIIPTKNLNLTNSITLNNTKNIILELNGKMIESTMSNNTNDSFINNGTLYIQDSVGTGIMKSNSILIKNNGILTINSGTYKNDVANESNVGFITNFNIATINNATIETNIWAINNDGNTATQLNINNSTIKTNISGGAIINNSTSSSGIINLNNSNITTTTNSVAASNVNVGKIIFTNSTINSYYLTIHNASSGIIEINGGTYHSTSSKVIYSNSSVTIKDSSGPVHMSTDALDSILQAIYDININGHRASKTTNGTTVYDTQACTNNSNDMDNGICFYSQTGYGINSAYGITNIEGITINTRYIAFYQVRNGTSTITDSYMKNFGSSCDATDQAFCSTIRNHYPGAVVNFNNSTIINEHGIAFISSNGTSTLNNIICTNSNACVSVESSSTTTINSGNYSSFTVTITNYNGNLYLNNPIVSSSSDVIYRGAVKIESNGNVYINGGTYSAPNGGSAFVLQGDSGNYYLCSGKSSGKYDVYDIGTNGKVYYSTDFIFKSGNNTPLTYPATSTVILSSTTACAR